MATFPRTESEISALAMALTTGLAENTEIYPSPPVPTPDLGTTYNEYLDAKNSQIAAQAAAASATEAKDDALETLVEGMKRNIRYAENTVDFDDDKLKLIGWAGRAEGTPLEIPGQTRNFEVVRQGEGWVVLDWKKPANGGAVSAYKVMRRERPEGPWMEAATAVNTEATLVEQPRSKELEYRIVAINKAGEGIPSNTEMVVL